MRAILVALCALILVAASPSATLAEDGSSVPAGDLDLAALRSAIEEFRADLAVLREACSVARGSVLKECAARYSELRSQFQTLKEQAIELARKLRDWRERAKEEADRFAKEAEKEQTQKQERASLGGKSLAEKLRWLENHMLRDRIDLDLFRQRAREAREAADQLTGEHREEALDIAERWERKANEYADGVKRHEAERLELLAKIANANKPQPETKKNQTSLEKLQAKLRALDEHMAQDRAELEQAHADGDDERVEMLEKGLVQHDKERAELVRQIEYAKKNGTVSSRDRLSKELKSVEEMIVYKRSKIAELRDVLAYKLAQVNATSGSEREQWQERARGVQSEIDQWTGRLNSLLAQKAELIAKLEALHK